MRRLILTTATTLIALVALTVCCMPAPAPFCLSPEAITQKFLHADNLVLGPVQLLLPEAQENEPVYVWLTGVGTIISTFDEEECQVNSVIKPGISLGRYLVAEFGVGDL